MPFKPLKTTELWEDMAKLEQDRQERFLTLLLYHLKRQEMKGRPGKIGVANRELISELPTYKEENDGPSTKSLHKGK